jgi:hypothetical protein
MEAVCGLFKTSGMLTPLHRAFLQEGLSSERFVYNLLHDVNSCLLILIKYLDLPSFLYTLSCKIIVLFS